MNHARSNRVVAIAATALALATLAGCGAKGGDKAADTTTATAAGSSTAVVTSTTAGATTTTTVATTSTTTGSVTTTTEDNSGDPGKEGSTSTSSNLDTLPTGIHYGYFAGLEDGKVEGQDVQVLLWDEVEFLQGDAAVAAAHAHHDIPDDQDYVDDDYYIVNDNQLVRHLAIVPDAQVTHLKDGGTDQEPSSPSDVYKEQGLFKIEIQNVRGISTITSVEGVFLP